MRQVTIFTKAKSWLGIGRILPFIQEQQFRVNLIAPAGSIVARSSCVDSVVSLPPESDDTDWEKALLSFADDRILVGDDTAIDWLLRRAAGNEPLLTVLRGALGDLQNVRIARDKFQLAHLAGEVGVPAPEVMPVNSEVDAGDLCTRLGWPFVLKGRHGHAGNEVFICRNLRQARSALASLTPQSQPFAQQYIEGSPLMVSVACHQGKMLSNFSAQKEACWPLDTGPSTVVKLAIEPLAEAHATALVAKLGLCGLLSFDFIQDAQKQYWLMECNLRPAPVCHFGDSLLQAWLNNVAVEPRIGNGESRALFPQSVLYPVPTAILHGAILDKPAKDAGLLAAMEEMITAFMDP